jgi:serine/tyrosine/threonine adenylyltransferase
VTAPTTLALGHAFADDLPELALPWTAADATEPRLLATPGS